MKRPTWSITRSPGRRRSIASRSGSSRPLHCSWTCQPNGCTRAAISSRMSQGRTPPRSMWKRMPRAPAAVRRSSSASLTDSIDDHDRTRRSAELGDRIHGAAIVGAVGRRLDDHDALEPEALLHLPVVVDARRRRQERGGRRHRIALRRVVEVDVGVGRAGGCLQPGPIVGHRDHLVYSARTARVVIDPPCSLLAVTSPGRDLFSAIPAAQLHPAPASPPLRATTFISSAVPLRQPARPCGFPPRLCRMPSPADPTSPGSAREPQPQTAGPPPSALAQAGEACRLLGVDRAGRGIGPGRSRRPGAWSRAPDARSPAARGRRCAASRRRCAAARGAATASGPARGPTSMAQPAMRPSTRAASSAVSSIRLPRDTLIRYALGCIRPSSAAPIRFSVSAVATASTTTKSDSAEQRAEIGPGQLRLGHLDVRIVDQHAHAQRQAELARGAVPIWP